MIGKERLFKAREGKARLGKTTNSMLGEARLGNTRQI
jgi:hypothetical protein